MGEGNFVTQPLVIVVEDVNDNVPVFLPHPQIVRVKEHSGPAILAKVEAKDRDSGIFGQVTYDIREESGLDGHLFTIDSVDGQVRPSAK